MFFIQKHCKLFINIYSFEYITKNWELKEPLFHSLPIGRQGEASKKVYQAKGRAKLSLPSGRGKGYVVISVL